MTINKSRLVLWLIIIVLILSIGCVLLFRLWRKERSGHTKWEANYYALNDSATIFKTRSGNQATLVRQLTFSIRDLKKSKSGVENELQMANKRIEDLSQSNKRLKAIVNADLEAQGEGKSKIRDTIYVDTIVHKLRYSEINDGYLYEDLMIYPDTVAYNYTYKEGISVVLNMRRKLNRNGNKVFWLWRWIQPWIPETTVVTENPKSVITGATQINFER